MKLHLVGVLCAVMSMSAHAAEGRWTEGYGQGNLEYFIDAQGMRLHIGCPTEDGSADTKSSVSFMRVSDSRDVPSFTITVAGTTFEGPFEADSRVGTNNFIALLDHLRKGNAVVKANNKSFSFPVSNAAKVLPQYGKKGFKCNTD
ncbi:MAG TPA: hypothetical protein VEB70_07345 [Noviherbaspirillum sp.]|nr:hypothetical protein [Noviherbaspirillum sp.]